MKLYRFSPIHDKEGLLEAVRYIHFSCYQLCKQVLGEYLPNAGNMGVFCHYEDEYLVLTKIREELTEASDNLDQKYYRLIEPIVIPGEGDIPETTYSHLYIRKPDPYRHHVGDVDFYLEPEGYAALKQSVVEGEIKKGIRMFDRPGWDMIELYDPDVDALAYISQKTMTEKVRVKMNDNSDLYIKVEQYIKDSFGEGHTSVKHLQRTAEWAREIDPTADEAMLVACLSHDIERADKARKDWGKDYMTNPDYLKHHQERGAEMMADFLSSVGLDNVFIERVKHLISKHEVGGDDDQNFIKDMDSLSFFENNVEHFLKSQVEKTGVKEVKEKFDWMFERITADRVKSLARPFYEDAISQLGQYGQSK